ncbi:GNAT family N-acetyltransferase [Pseudoalteromonas xiamenensis]
MFEQPSELKGAHVTLELLSEAHIDALEVAVMDGQHFNLWYANVPKPQEMGAYVLNAMEMAKKGNIAYAVRENQTGLVVGTTRYYDVSHEHKRACIGYTWYADAVRRTAVNTECKLMLLAQLFEREKAIAAEFRTHVFNQASRQAIERLGAKQDGILRSHQILKDGSIRDTAVYSILAHEWPSVKNHLLSKFR